MNKTDLVKGVSQEAGITASQAKLAVDAFLRNLNDALIQGEPVHLRGVGTIRVKIREAARKHPKTGVVIPGVKAVHIGLRPASHLLEKIKERRCQTKPPSPSSPPNSPSSEA